MKFCWSELRTRTLWTYHVFKQVVGVPDHFPWQLTGWHGDQHHLEAAELQEEEEYWGGRHGSGSGPGRLWVVFCVSLRWVQVTWKRGKQLIMGMSGPIRSEWVRTATAETWTGTRWVRSPQGPDEVFRWQGRLYLQSVFIWYGNVFYFTPYLI